MLAAYQRNGIFLLTSLSAGFSWGDVAWGMTRRRLKISHVRRAFLRTSLASCKAALHLRTGRLVERMGLPRREAKCRVAAHRRSPLRTRYAINIWKPEAQRKPKTRPLAISSPVLMSQYLREGSGESRAVILRCIASGFVSE